MLGSIQDAEDALQESLIAAWRGLPRFEGRSSLRTWLYRVATNVCIRLISRRPRRILSPDHGPPREDPGTSGSLSPSRSGSSRGSKTNRPPRSRTPTRPRPSFAGRGSSSPSSRRCNHCRHPAGRPAAARRARVLRHRDSHDPRHDAGVGEQRAPASPQDRPRAGPGHDTAGRAGGTRCERPAPAGRRLRDGLGKRRRRCIDRAARP